MTSAIDSSTALTPFPDHTQLPESDGTFVFAERAEGKNFQEHPQSILLTDSIKQYCKNVILMDISEYGITLATLVGFAR